VFGAASLLRDQYIVDWDGELPRVPKYAPGFPALLAPAVALGGIQSAIWVPYLGVFVLGGLIALMAAELGGPLIAPLAVASVRRRCVPPLTIARWSASRSFAVASSPAARASS
jgi:hypothetical protein